MNERAAPPTLRSRAACAFSAAAAAGVLRMQRCRACARVCYPAREACPACWSAELEWVEVPDGGRLLVDTTLHNSFDPYFGERLPWRIGTVQLSTGTTVLAHVHLDVDVGSPLRLIARTDRTGQGVLIALPEQQESTMIDDRQLRTLTCDPSGCTALVSDVDNPVGGAVAESLARAGAARVYGGAGGTDKGAGPEGPEALAGVTIVPLDPAERRSLADFAATAGASLDVVVSTGCLIQPGSVLESENEVGAEREMGVNYFNLLRLSRVLGPALCRGERHAGDALRAWVNVLSVHALPGGAGFATAAASQAAALSLSRSLRAELAGKGVKVIEILCGPLDNDLNAAFPGPKIGASQIASAVVHALQQGIEHLAVGPVADDILRRYEEHPMGYEREHLPA